jgi:two-component system sensor histidine kinase RegB
MWVATRSLGLLFLRQQKEISHFETKRNLLEKHNQISLLVSGIVHELGTPLNTVRLKVDKLLRDKNSIDDRDIEILDKSVKRLETTTHQLNLAQSAQDQGVLSLLNLSDLIESTIIILQKEYPLSIENKIESHIMAETNALSIQLLLSNCVQNCVDENIHLLEVSLSKENGSILLKIQDSGPGFSKHVLDNFKAPYNTTKGQGRGLGLYNCVLSLEASGGGLSIYNDNGAVVELYLAGKDNE